MKPGIFAHWPNRITALRFVGSIALFVLLARWCDLPAGEVDAHPALFQAAFWLFVVTGLSDILDGWLARRSNLVTAFGRIADPFVDKVLVMGTMVLLIELPWSAQYFPAWVVVVILSREFLVTAIRGYVERLGHDFPADWFGKVKMLTQCLAIGAVLSLPAFRWGDPMEGVIEGFGVFCVWATLATSVGSGASYVFKTARILKGEPT